MNPYGSEDGGGQERPRPSQSQASSAARRAMRARDRLERKRAKERTRIQRERQRVESTRSRRPLDFAIAPLAFGLAAGLGFLVALPVVEFVLLRPTALERVAVQGASSLEPRMIARRAGIQAGSMLGSLEPSELVRTLEAEPWIESARALRLPTGSLVLSVVERSAIALWRPEPNNGPLLVDQWGKRFAGALEPGGALPLVRGSAGEIGGAGALPAEALEILGEIGRHVELAHDPAEVILHLPGVQATAEGALLGSQTGYVLQLGEGGPRALLGRRLFSERVARLAALVETREPTLLRARLIDLRYADRAVLQTEPASG